jgi:hypothetical protein
MSIIYLILSAEIDEDGEIVQKILKIGYTSERNKKRRFKAYELHNPGCRILSTIKGTRKDESALHEYFKDLHWRGEWFKYDSRIIDYFKAREIGMKVPEPTITNNRIYWKDMNEVKLWLMGKYGVKESYIKVLFDFPDPTLFEPEPFIDSKLYNQYLELIDSIFKAYDDKTAKSIGCLRNVKYKIQSLVFSKGMVLKKAITEMSKTLLGKS